MYANQSILFFLRDKKNTQTIPLVFDGINLEKVNSIKFLGVILDSNLTWTNHVDDVHSKISKTIGIMNRLKFFVPKHVLLTLYNSLVLPYLNYSVVTWGGSSSCDRLFILQKRAIRLISGASFREHTLPLFANLKLLQFSNLYYLNVGKFMYKFMNGFFTVLL